MVACAQAVHTVMRMAVLCKQNADPEHATNLHKVEKLYPISLCVRIDASVHGPPSCLRRALLRRARTLVLSLLLKMHLPNCHGLVP